MIFLDHKVVGRYPAPNINGAITKCMFDYLPTCCICFTIFICTLEYLLVTALRTTASRILCNTVCYLVTRLMLSYSPLSPEWVVQY